MKKLFILFFILTTSVFSQGVKDITIQLSWLHQFQFAGYYIAKEKGFYKDIGLNVHLKEMSKDISVVDMIEEEKVDFAIGRSSLLIDKMNGKDIVALTAVFQNSPLMLLVREDSNIKTIDDLKNKKIMINPDARSSASILAMLNANKLSNDDLNFIPHSFNVEDLISGKTDAMASYISNEPIVLEDRNINYKIFHPKDYGFNFYNDILFTSSKYIKNNKKLTKEFLFATIKGWKYAFENISETAELIHLKYNSQNKSLLNLIKEGEVLKRLVFDEDGEFGCLEKERLVNIANVFNVLGVSSPSSDFVSEFIYEHNPHHEISFSYSVEEKNIFIISVFFLVILILLVFLLFRKIYMDKNLINSVIDSTDDLIYYKDKKLRYIGCNEAFAKFVGKTKEEIIGKTIYDILDEKTSDYFSLVDKNVLNTNQSEIASQWVSSFNGEKIYLENRKRPFYYNFKDIGIVGVCRDLTKVLKLEEEHLKQQKSLLLQSKIVAMGEMLGNIAHQWRQPLSVITTTVSGLKLSSELGDDITIDRIDECSSEVIKQATYLSKTIEDFKSFFSSDEGRIEEFNVKEVFDKMNILISESFLDSNIQIKREIASCNMIHNKKSFIQSILNILNNSKDAFIRNSINIEHRFIFINVIDKNKDIEIYIKDSAGGIKENIIDKIFEPYFTTKHKSQGTGIGLYMTHQMIKNHFNGQIYVENEKFEYENKKLEGVVFKIIIPKD